MEISVTGPSSDVSSPREFVGESGAAPVVIQTRKNSTTTLLVPPGRRKNSESWMMLNL